MGVKVGGQLFGVKVGVKFQVKVGGVKVRGLGQGSRSWGQGWGSLLGVKVRGRGSRSGELGSDGQWGLVGGGWR